MFIKVIIAMVVIAMVIIITFIIMIMIIVLISMVIIITFIIMIMVNVIGEERRGKLMGLRLLTNRFAQIVSPLMFGLIGQIFGLRLAFLAGGAVLFFVLGALAVPTRRNRGSAALGRDAHGPGP